MHTTLRAMLAVVLSCYTCAAQSIHPVGVPNCHVVNEHLFRGAQPHVHGFKSLASLGVRTIIDLRGEAHEVPEEQLVRAAGMRYIHFPLNGYTAPTDGQIASLLGLLDDSSGWPVFIHCRRGADRTGTVIACYRILHDHWANEKALSEARLYGMSPAERAMQGYVLHFKPSAANETKPILTPAKPAQ